jgi:hypothetical protein
MEVTAGALTALFVVVGLVLVCTGLARPFFVAVAFGAVFIALSLVSGWVILVATASELSLDAAGRELRWRASLRSYGALEVADLSSIRRDRRPGVYSLRCRDGSHVEFWLARRGDDVAALFDELGRRNPRMDAWELYTRTGTWWRGLPPPG